MITTRYTVKGMTCGHCVSSVSEELSALAGVTDVVVDLGAAVTVTSDEALNVDSVQAAVGEAGYELIP